MTGSEQVLSVCLVVIIFYFYKRYMTKFSYWKKRNIKHETPYPIIGNHGRKILNKMTNAEVAIFLSQKYSTEEFIGYYRGGTPELYVMNPKFFPYILNSDFDHFYVRGIDADENEERLFINLITCSGDNWKLLRHRLTPAFTSVKLVKMVPLLAECAEKLQTAAGEGCINASELMARYTIECICSCGFGLDANNITKKENSQFLDLGANILSKKSWERYFMILIEAVESIGPILRFLYLFGVNPNLKKAFIGLVKTLRKERNFKPSNRNDFIDLLLELESLGNMRGVSFEKKNPDGTPMEVELEMDIEILTAQVITFFGAGYSTSAIASSVTLHLLAFNPKEQTRILKHIDEVFAKHNNKITYESLNEMNLLEMAVKEAMRLFPPAATLPRICTKKYTFPGTDLTIDPGVRVVIPTCALHMNEKFYDNPTEFKPERFSPEALSKRPKYTYLAFGEGQRKCIGARLAMIMTMAGVAAILQRYTVEPAPNSTRELEIDRNFVGVNFAKGGIPLKLVPREKFN